MFHVKHSGVKHLFWTVAGIAGFLVIIAALLWFFAQLASMSLLSTP